MLPNIAPKPALIVVLYHLAVSKDLNQIQRHNQNSETCNWIDRSNRSK